MPDVAYTAGQRIPGAEPYCVVERQLGSGGHGVVYRVHHERLIAKRAALKILNAELSNRADIVERMRREAETLAAIDHKHIVSVIDAGVTSEATPRPYIVMELLNGFSLREGLQLRDSRRGLGFKTSLNTAIAVADALSCAHEKHRLIHRDVKPDNVFLHRTSDEDIVPKLLDFGVIHIFSLDRRQTGKTNLIGTPQYCAPEQLLGKPPTPQTDLYALGLLLYEMLTGKPPFDDARSIAEIGEAHLKREPPELCIFPRPASLDVLMKSLLAKDAKQRPRSAAWVATELRAIKRTLEREFEQVTDLSKTDRTPIENRLSNKSATDPDGAVVSSSATTALAAPMEPRLGTKTLVGTPEIPVGGGLYQTLENAYADITSTLPAGMPPPAEPVPATPKRWQVDRQAPTRTLDVYVAPRAWTDTDDIPSEEAAKLAKQQGPESTRWHDIGERADANEDTPRPAAGAPTTRPPVFTTARGVASTMITAALATPARSFALTAVVSIGMGVLLFSLVWSRFGERIVTWRTSLTDGPTTHTEATQAPAEATPVASASENANAVGSAIGAPPAPAVASASAIPAAAPQIDAPPATHASAVVAPASSTHEAKPHAAPAASASAGRPLFRDAIHDDTTAGTSSDTKHAKPAHAAPSAAPSSTLPKRPGLDF